MTIISYIYVYGAYKILRLFMLSGYSNMLLEIKPKIKNTFRLIETFDINNTTQIIRLKSLTYRISF